MSDAQLQVQASLWDGELGRHALLFLEGNSAVNLERHGGEEPITLLNVVLQRGMQLVPDSQPPEQVEPAIGWHVRMGSAGVLTVDWPHTSPLLAEVPLDLPAGWTTTADERGGVLLFVGEGLGLREHADGGVAHPLDRMADAARRGALAGGLATWEVRDS
jgi:hypothetical protein